METFTVKPEGYFFNKDNIPLEVFSIDFNDADLDARSTSYVIKLGEYGFEHEFEFHFHLENLRHSIEQLCFRHSKAWLDFPFDDTVTRLDCETFSEGNSGFGRDLILVKIIPNGYVREYDRINSNTNYEELEESPLLGSHIAYVDAKDFISELYTKIMKIADGEYTKGALSPVLFRQKFKSPIIEQYLSTDRLEQDDSIVLPR